MQVWGITESDVKYAVAKVSRDNYRFNLGFATGPSRMGKTDRSPLTMTLRVLDSRGPGARHGHMRNNDGSRRRTVAACWHAHRDVMAELFALGATRVKTWMADYRSEADFYRLFPMTADQNIGSMVDWMSMGDACDCDRFIEEGVIEDRDPSDAYYDRIASTV